MFFLVFRGAGICGVAKAIYKQFVLPTWACATGLNNNNYNNILSLNNPVEVLNEHLSLLDGRYVPTKVIHVLNKDKSWFHDQCRRAFGLNQDSHLRCIRDRSRVNWEAVVRC